MRYPKLMSSSKRCFEVSSGPLLPSQSSRKSRWGSTFPPGVNLKWRSASGIQIALIFCPDWTQVIRVENSAVLSPALFRTAFQNLIDFGLGPRVPLCAQRLQFYWPGKKAWIWCTFVLIAFHFWSNYTDLLPPIIDTFKWRQKCRFVSVQTLFFVWNSRMRFGILWPNIAFLILEGRV
jgi:hypothetical protein